MTTINATISTANKNITIIDAFRFFTFVNHTMEKSCLASRNRSFTQCKKHTQRYLLQNKRIYRWVLFCSSFYRVEKYLKRKAGLLLKKRKKVKLATSMACHCLYSLFSFFSPCQSPHILQERPAGTRVWKSFASITSWQIWWVLT